MGIGTTCEIALLCIDTIYRSSNDREIISAYRKYRELMGLPRYAEWDYYSNDLKMQNAMYLSILDEIKSKG